MWCELYNVSGRKGRGQNQIIKMEGEKKLTVQVHLDGKVPGAAGAVTRHGRSDCATSGVTLEERQSAACIVRCDDEFCLYNTQHRNQREGDVDSRMNEKINGLFFSIIICSSMKCKSTLE